MSSRPKSTDTEADLQKMQDDYEKQKQDGSLRPAATAHNKREPKQSVFAKQRKLKKEDEGNKPLKASDVIGDVLERKYDISDAGIDNEDTPKASGDDTGFPKMQQIDASAFKETEGKTIFSQLEDKVVEPKNNKEVEAMETDEPNAGPSQESPKDSIAGIHEQNMEIMNSMSQEEKLEEKARLEKILGPNALDLFKSKRTSSQSPQKPSAKQARPGAVQSPPPKAVQLPQPKADEPALPDFKDLPVLDFLNDEKAGNWLHFDTVEDEKLEWMKNVDKTHMKLNPGQSYEARFDWKGFLQPYVDREPENNKDDRELYMHGEDAQRPGYTLAEFFRLCRANVLQQRVAAINAIGGIISIYNQGYYDGILELPISKIFFLLRIAMDENIPAVVEVSSRALAFLFYNETDETLLDLAYETRNGKFQPVLCNKKASLAGSVQDETEADFESSLKNLSIDGNTKLFQSNLDDLIEDDGKDNDKKNDYVLAEISLVECFMRTTIVQRINYIMTVTEPSEITVRSCVKILIRLARKSRDFAVEILNADTLIAKLIVAHLPSLETSNMPSPFVIKLFRVMSAYDRAILAQLRSYGVVDIVKGYISTMKEGNVALWKLQIESFRFMRLYFHHFPDEMVFKELIAPIQFHMNFHFQQLDFKSEGHFFIRQHAASLLYLLGCGNRVVTFPVFAEKFKMCCCKWFTMATREGAREFSQKILLSALLEVGAGFVTFSSEMFYDFVKKYLNDYMHSSHYQKTTSELCETSPLFHYSTDRCNVHKPLVNLGAVVRKHKKSEPSLILTNEYSTYLMDSLLIFISAFNSPTNVKNHEVHHDLCSWYFTEDFERYLEGFAKRFNRNLIANWFLKTEIDFIYSLLNSPSLQFNDCLVKVAFNLLPCLTQENYLKILEIFQKFLNCRYFYTKDVSTAEFERWKTIYNGVVISKLNQVKPTVKCAIVERWNQLMLNDSWPYSLLLLLLYNAEVEGPDSRIVETDLSEDEIIMTSLKFTLVLERNNVNLISNNQQLMYLMTVYFAKNLSFRDDAVKALIRQKMKALKGYEFPPKFNFKLNKEKSFESLYTMFLDTFQSSSYGDDLFSVLVMIPLNQKYDAKWRKLVWSENVASMTFISCKETDLMDDFNEYLYPVETDISILRSYSMAMATNVLRKDSVPWKIAKHHLENARKTAN